MRLAGVAVLAASFAGLLPAVAAASTATLDGDVLEVTGTAGVDRLTIFADGDGLVVRDGFVPTSAGVGCALTAVRWATCPLASIARVEVDLGDGDDVIEVASPRPVVVDGGAGDDTLLAGASPIGVTLDGGPGDDHLAGSRSGDVLLGGPGDDGLSGGPGNDLVDPGAGRDAVADEGGGDTILARDGEPDFLDCGPGSDRGTFDATDFTQGCEGAPARGPADCTPEIEPPAAGAARRLVREGTLRIRFTVADGCRASASLAVAGVTYARAAASPAAGGVVLRPGAAGRGALRRGRAAVVVVRVRAPGGAVITRAFRIGA